MSRKIFKLMDLLDINDDFLNRRGITLDPPETRNELEVPTNIQNEDFSIMRDVEKSGVKSITKFEVKIERDNGNDEIPPPNPFFPSIPFALYILGVVKAGKTTLLNSILDLYVGGFDNIVFISPTATIDMEQQQIIEKYDIKNVYSSLSIISKIMSEALAVNKGKRNKDKVKTLIIMDDVINELIKHCKKEDNFINKLATNRRHYGLSFILLSQYYKRCPPLLRTNFSSLALFRQENQAERKKIVEELSGFLGKKRFEELFDQATQEPFSFMSINYDTTDKKYQYTKNFNTILINDNDINKGFKLE